MDIYGNAKKFDSNYDKQIIELSHIEKINKCIGFLYSKNNVSNKSLVIYLSFVFISTIIGSWGLYNDIEPLGYICSIFGIYNILSLLFVFFELTPSPVKETNFFDKWCAISFFLSEKLENLYVFLERKKRKKEIEYIQTYLSDYNTQCELLLPLYDLRNKLSKSLKVQLHDIPKALLYCLENKDYIGFCKHYLHVDSYIYEASKNIVPNVDSIDIEGESEYYNFLYNYKKSKNLNDKLNSELIIKQPENNSKPRRNKI